MKVHLHSPCNPIANPKCYWMGRNVMEERRELSLMGDYIMRLEACIHGQLLLHEQKKKKRRSLNGILKKDHY